MQDRYHTFPTPDILSITHYTSGKYTVPIPDILSPTQFKTDIIPSPRLTYWASHSAGQILHRTYFWHNEPHALNFRYHTAPTSDIPSLTQCRSVIITFPLLHTEPQTVQASYHNFPTPDILSLTRYTSDSYHTVPTPDTLILAHKTVVKINNFTVNIGLRNMKGVLERKWSCPMLQYSTGFCLQDLQETKVG